MASQFIHRQLEWRMIALAVGPFTLIALPVVRADAYAVSENHDLSTIAESRSIVVHTATPGRYALHVDTTLDVSCFGCDENDDSDITHDIAQRYAIATSVQAIRTPATLSLADISVSTPTSSNLVPEFLPPKNSCHQIFPLSN